MNPVEVMRGIKVVQVGDLITAALNTDSNSDRIDTAGFEAVLFVCEITDSAATGVASMQIEQNTIDSDSGMARIGSDQAETTCVENDDLNGKKLVIGVHRPRERYIQCVRESATANIAFGELYAILIGFSKHPVSDALVADSVFFNSPAEG